MSTKSSRVRALKRVATAETKRETRADVMEPEPERARRAAPSDAEVDATLKALIVRGQHAQALGLMMGTYGDRIGRFFLRRTGRRAWSEDLTQETFIRAMRGLRKFRCESRVLTWLTRIAYNVLCTQVGRQSRLREGHARLVALERAESTDVAPAPSVHTLLPDRAVRRREVMASIDACLDRMNDVIRELAILVWVEGHTFVEAAQITGMSEDAVRKRLCRARPALQRCLERRGVMGPEGAL